MSFVKHISLPPTSIAPTHTCCTGITEAGHTLVNQQFFDTLLIKPNCDVSLIKDRATTLEINLRYFDDGLIGVSLDETVEVVDVDDLLSVFGSATSAVSRLTPRFTLLHSTALFTDDASLYLPLSSPPSEITGQLFIRCLRHRIFDLEPRKRIPDAPHL